LETIPRRISEPLSVLRAQYPVITTIGPRQSGRTTICPAVFDNLPYVNFEQPDMQQRFSEDPRAFPSE
jgi:hypothetical protein